MSARDRILDDAVWLLNNDISGWIVFSEMTRLQWEGEDHEVIATGVHSFLYDISVFWVERVPNCLIVCEGSHYTDPWNVFNDSNEELVESFLSLVRLCSVVIREMSNRDRLLDVENPLTRIARPTTGPV